VVVLVVPRLLGVDEEVVCQCQWSALKKVKSDVLLSSSTNALLRLHL